jgi:hypothetical protein
MYCVVWVIVREQISDLRLGFPYGVPVTSKEIKKHDMKV